jgi:hypothetical protein
MEITGKTSRVPLTYVKGTPTPTRREIIFDAEYNKIKRVPGRILDDVNFKNAKVYKISHVVNDILYIGFKCDKLKACFFQHIQEAKFKKKTYCR